MQLPGPKLHHFSFHVSSAIMTYIYIFEYVYTNYQSVNLVIKKQSSSMNKWCLKPGRTEDANFSENDQTKIYAE